MSVQQKVRIAQELEALGVNTIESGFPAASENDFAAVHAIAAEVTRSKICAFARAAASDIEQAARAVANAHAPQIEILGTSSDIHLQYKRQITRQQALDETASAIQHARMVGFRDICLATEDATRADFEFLHAICQVSAEAGATMIVIPDTVGCLLPTQVGGLIDAVRASVPADVKLAMHAHDDLGLATANTLAAIEAGIDEVQVTLCGIGDVPEIALLKLEALGLSPTRSVVERIYQEVTKSDEPVCSDNKRRLLAIECAAGRTFAEAAALAGNTNGADLAPHRMDPSAASI